MWLTWFSMFSSAYVWFLVVERSHAKFCGIDGGCWCVTVGGVVWF